VRHAFAPPAMPAMRWEGPRQKGENKRHGGVTMKVDGPRLTKMVLVARHLGRQVGQGMAERQVMQWCSMSGVMWREEEYQQYDIQKYREVAFRTGRSIATASCRNAKHGTIAEGLRIALGLRNRHSRCVHTDVRVGAIPAAGGR